MFVDGTEKLITVSFVVLVLWTEKSSDVKLVSRLASSISSLDCRRLRQKAFIFSRLLRVRLFVLLVTDSKFEAYCWSLAGTVVRQFRDHLLTPLSSFHLKLKVPETPLCSRVCRRRLARWIWWKLRSFLERRFFDFRESELPSARTDQSVPSSRRTLLTRLYLLSFRRSDVVVEMYSSGYLWSCYESHLEIRRSCWEMTVFFAVCDICSSSWTRHIFSIWQRLNHFLRIWSKIFHWWTCVLYLEFSSYFFLSDRRRARHFFFWILLYVMCQWHHFFFYWFSLNLRKSTVEDSSSGSPGTDT